jgi:YD repeat-containing protein
MTRIRAAIVLAISMVALAAQAGEDPQTNRGVDLSGVYHSGDIDTVNVQNGNVIIAIPMATQFPLNGGFSYGIHLIYTGQPWDFPEVLGDGGGPEYEYRPSPTPNRRSNAGLGWRVTMGRLIPPSDPTNTSCSGGEWGPCGYWAYESPDGADHFFSQGTNPYYTDDGSYLRMTIDAQAHREIDFPDGTIQRFDNFDFTPSAIYTPFDRAAQAGPSVTIEALTNTDGSNRCGDTTAYFCWKITDTIGRTQHVMFANDPNLYGQLRATKIIVTAPGGALVTYALRYNSDTASTSPPNPDVTLQLDSIGCYGQPQRWATPSSFSVPLLTSIGLPDGSQYEVSAYQVDFANLQPDDPLCSQGSIKMLTLPTLARIGYTYQNYLHNHGKQRSAPYVPGIKDRTKTPADGSSAQTWNYTSALSDVSVCPPLCPSERRELRVTITEPDNRVSRHYFSIADTDDYSVGWSPVEWGLPFTRKSGTSTTDPMTSEPRYLSSEVLDAAGNVERSTYVKYDYDYDPQTSIDEMGLFRREQASLTKYAGTGCGNDGTEQCWSSVNRSDFDHYGHFRKTETDGNFAVESSRHLDYRAEFVNYNNARGTWGTSWTAWPEASPWVLNTFDTQWVNVPKSDPNDAAASHTKKTEFCFDSDTGFLKRRRVLWKDATTAAGIAEDGADQIAVFTGTSDSSGNLFSEQYYGGDTASLDTGSLCDLDLSTPRYEIHHTYQNGVRAISQYFSNGSAMPFKTLDRTIDLSGSVSSERDVAEVETTYTPDPDDPLRIKTVTTTGTDPITYTYSNASISGSSFTPAEIGVSQSDVYSRVQYDSFGRIWREFRTMPAIGEVSRETLYDSSNRKLSQSVWDASSYTNKTAFHYDFLGRLDKVTQPDGSVVATSYAGDSKRTTTGSVVSSTDAPPATTPISTVEQMDRYGRIWYLKEPNDNVTAYGYGVTGALSRVCMNASLTPGRVLSTVTCGQERKFAYDNRGFLASETHPENGKVSYTYDALGHVLTKRLAATGPFDLNYTYDDAERLTQIESRETATSMSFRVSKVFTFGTSNGLTNKKRGKLETATRHNYRPVSGSSDIDIRITETYEYNDSAGRLTDRTTEIKDLTTTGGISETVTQKQEYTTLGQVSLLTYPSCLSGVACGQPNAASVGLTHTNGWLTAIPSTGSYASLGYHPSGMINTVSHGNGITDTQSVDTTNGMPRPESITFDGFGSCVRPVFSSLPNPTLDSAIIKSGNTKTWTVGASGSGTLNYQWYKDGHALAEPSASLTTEPLYDGPHTYFVRVANSCGLIQSNTATITIAVPPGITVQPHDAVFSPPSVRLTVTMSTSASPAPDYQWYQGTGPTDPARIPVGLNQSYFDTPNLATTTKYFVHVSNIGGFVDSQTATVTVPLPIPCCLSAAMPNTLSVQPVHLTWGFSSGAHHYEIWRREHAGSLHKIGESSSTNYDDASIAADTAYFYEVCASPAQGAQCTSGFSNQDLATTVAFRDITADRTVHLVDLTQLLTAVNAVRAASPGSDGLPVAWAGILQASPAPTLHGLVYGEHVTALRTQMEAALGRLGFSQHTYTDPILPNSPRVTIRAIHITELRDRIQ